ncbi:MAG: adenylate/guanylate cyclase domain-containing protein [Desulfarculus sp.]|nr:adenylate/guanylate cyclase domain-containing protein [Desulfarculus sp.]
MNWKGHLTSLLLGLGLTALALCLYLVQPRFLALMELKAGDALFWARGPLPMASGQVVLVAVGERSLHALGRWPWPRHKLAELIEALAGQGVKAMGLDMGFFEPDQRLEEEAVMALAKAALEGRPLSLDQVRQRFHPDHLLAQTLRRHREKVVLGYYFHMGGEDLAHVDQAELRHRLRDLQKFALPPTRYASPAAMERGPLTAQAPESNQPILAQAALSAGFFNVVPDDDGVVRAMPLVMQCGDRYFPGLGLAVLARYLGEPLRPARVEDFGLEEVRLGALRVPVDERGQMRINFRGGHEVIPQVEACDVLQGKVPAERLAGKAAILAVTATGVFDMRTTPFASLEPGGGIQAQVLDNLLAGDFLTRPAWARIFDLAAILALGLVAALCCGVMPLVPGWLLTLGAGTGYVLGCYQLFVRGHPLGLVYPLLGLVATGLGLTVYRNLTEVRDKRRLRSAFQQYLNPAVIERALREPGGLKLGGEKKVLTVLASDIRGFTSISEKLAPERLAHLLNDYMDQMTAEVLEQDGLLDKYIGDAVMAVYGAPAPQADHAARACRTALGMVRQAEALSRQWQAEGLPPLSIGIGINSGPMVVGNMGSHRRFDYTVIGDNVNTAFRVEGQCKVYGVGIIVCQPTRDLCQDQFQFRVLDLIQVKGRREPVAIYELLGLQDQGPGPALAAQCQVAFQAYLARDFARAETLYQAVLQDRPQDQPAQIMAARCRRYLEDPPPADWSGVEVKTEK